MVEIGTFLIKNATQSVIGFIILLLALIGFLVWTLWRRISGTHKMKESATEIKTDIGSLLDDLVAYKKDLEEYKQCKDKEWEEYKKELYDYLERKFRGVEHQSEEKEEMLKENKELIQRLCDDSLINQKSVNDLIKNMDMIISKIIDLIGTTKEVSGTMKNVAENISRRN